MLSSGDRMPERTLIIKYGVDYVELVDVGYFIFCPPLNLATWDRTLSVFVSGQTHDGNRRPQSQWCALCYPCLLHRLAFSRLTKTVQRYMK